MVEITLYRKQNDVAFGGTSPTCLYPPRDIMFFPDNFSKHVLQKISFMYMSCNRAPLDVLETSKGKKFCQRYKNQEIGVFFGIYPVSGKLMATQKPSRDYSSFIHNCPSLRNNQGILW